MEQQRGEPQVCARQYGASTTRIRGQGTGDLQVVAPGARAGLVEGERPGRGWGGQWDGGAMSKQVLMTAGDGMTG